MTPEEVKAMWIEGFSQRMDSLALIEKIVAAAYRRNYSAKNARLLSDAYCTLKNDLNGFVEIIKYQGFLLYVGAHV